MIHDPISHKIFCGTTAPLAPNRTVKRWHSSESVVIVGMYTIFGSVFVSRFIVGLHSLLMWVFVLFCLSSCTQFSFPLHCRTVHNFQVSFRFPLHCRAAHIFQVGCRFGLLVKLYTFSSRASFSTTLSPLAATTLEAGILTVFSLCSVSCQNRTVCCVFSHINATSTLVSCWHYLVGFNFLASV